MQDKIDYNRRQAAKYGSTPLHFNADDFDEQLIDAIRMFQIEHGLTADGMCGPSTYRRLWTKIESTAQYIPYPDVQEGDKYIVHNGHQIEIFWDKVLLWTDEGGKKATKYTSMAGQPERDISMFVSHWDVCLTSLSCYNVLEQRGLSVHFGIDNDGTIHQWLDTQHIAYHAGGKKNPHVVGVEISNAYYTKWQSWYEKKGFGKRPVHRHVKIHDETLEPYLGFYDVQVEALAALWEAVSFACGIPLQLPAADHKIDKDVLQNKFSGFINHYHFTAHKIDCAGLDNQAVLDWAKQLRALRSM